MSTAESTSTTELPLAGKVAIVTGGSRGIGAGIVDALAGAGARVVYTYSSDAEHEVPDSREGAAGSVRSVKVDSTDRTALRAAVREVAGAEGRLDVLVNNAGTGTMVPLVDLSDEDIERTVDLNIYATIFGTQEAVKHMSAGGRVINIGSINADRVPFPGYSVYSMTKAAIPGFTRALARELGGAGITVNAIQPGPIDTSTNPADGPWSDSIRGLVAAGRYGERTEIGAVVRFLAGPEAAYITGATINVDGGLI